MCDVGLSDEQVYLLMSAFDKDGDGRVCSAELASILLCKVETWLCNAATLLNKAGLSTSFVHDIIKNNILM